MSNSSAPAMTISLPDTLPPEQQFLTGIRRAPHRGFRLTRPQTVVALKNPLRYFPQNLYDELIPEFLEELKTRGRILLCLNIRRLPSLP